MSIRIAGKEVGPIGFGMMGLTVRRNPIPDESSFAAIKTAIDSGCTYFNGGEHYGLDPEKENSLTLLRRYFDKYPEDADKIVLNIKGCLRPNRFPDGSRTKVLASMDNLLKQLGPRGRISQFEPARKDPDVDFEEQTLRTIESYVTEGRFDAIAVSEVSAQTLRSAAKKFNITSLELELSLFWTEPIHNGQLATCYELGIPVVAYCRGFLGGQIKSPDDLDADDFRRMTPRFQGENFNKNLDLVIKVEALAQKKGCTPGEVAIGWLLQLSKRPGMPTIIPIPGSTNPDRIKENATVIDLTEEDMNEIDEILASFKVAGTRYPEAFMKHLEL